MIFLVLLLIRKNKLSLKNYNYIKGQIYQCVEHCIKFSGDRFIIFCIH